MKSKRKHLAAIWLFIGVLLVGFAVLPGCETSQPKDHDVSTKGQQAVQTNCPVMEAMAIDKSVYTEHQGKKVYFCCAGCINTFKENPQQYLSKLPQFNQ